MPAKSVRIGWLTGWLWLGLVSSLCAEPVLVGTLPSRNVGFRVDFALEAVGGNGYQPIHVTVRPIGQQFNRDHRIGVIIEPRNDQDSDLDFRFREEFVAPESATSYQTTLLVPHYFPWDVIDISLLEDGVPIETGRRGFSLSSQLRVRHVNQTLTVGVVVARDAAVQDAAWKACPDVRALVTALGQGPIPDGSDAKIERLTHQASLDLAKQVQPANVQFRVLDETDLPTEWLALSQLDILIIAGPVVERVTTENPPAAKAIERWLAAGGNLWIYASDLALPSWVPAAAYQTPPASSVIGAKLLNDQLDLNSKNDTSRLVHQHWGVVKESQVYGFRNSNSLRERREVMEELRKIEHPLTRIQPAAEVVKGLRFASFGLGTVVAISDEDPFPGSFQFWKSVAEMHPPLHLIWSDRMGIDVPAGNDNYWMWLLASLGQPPVKSFVLLNTLFAVVVGPLCYFYFRRHGRLYLLYFFAPLLALVITASLFVFALVSDGIQTKVRSRQLTWVDPEAGYQVQQARQTYYAVMSRDKGIELSDQVAVYPVQHSPALDYSYYGRRNRSDSGGEVIVADGRRIHRGSFLPSRNQVQYLSMNVAERPGVVRFSVEDSLAINDLERRLRQLIVRDFDGKYWITEELQPGEQARAIETDSAALNQLLGPDVRPTLGEVPMLRRSYFTFGGVTTAGVQVSLLENRLEEWSGGMPRGSFLGITDLDQELLGVDDATILDSVHVIMGWLPK